MAIKNKTVGFEEAKVLPSGESRVSKEGTSFWGDEEKVPFNKEKAVDDLTAFVIDEQKAKPKAKTSKEEFSGFVDPSVKIEEELDEKIAEEEAKIEQINAEEEAEGFDFDLLDGEMIFEFWDSARSMGHQAAYHWAIYQHPKQAKKKMQELALKQNRTAHEQKLLKALIQFINEHDELKEDYFSKVAYSEKHKALLIKFIDYQLKKMQASGRKVTKMGMWGYLLLAEAIPLVSLLQIRMDMPELNVEA